MGPRMDLAPGSAWARQVDGLVAKGAGCGHDRVTPKEPQLPAQREEPPPAPRLRPASDPFVYMPPLKLDGSEHAGRGQSVTHEGTGALPDCAWLLEQKRDYTIEAVIPVDWTVAENAEVCAAVSPLPSCVLEAAMASAVAERTNMQKKLNFAM
mmetsp:Transcript_145737/g.363387  ORF Transcript_145737/g.363387 Transcript_145737/m.363387 type:complete len:153 (+) Transcript_145737:81-539(+)